ncbi:glycosyltransferase family 1 protein [Alkalibacterium putridalgicola]|uniref:glycosyltransferase family 1 protein n=1 Tax=Alkalibacterium putridalgicola TaxID=426703 RepID=UPI0034D00C9D
MNKKPVRVLHVLGYFDFGGTESLVMNTFRHIDRSQVVFDFVVHSEKEGAYEKEAKELGAKIYRVPQYNGKNHLAYKKAWRSFFDAHPEYDIIHGHVRSTANIYLAIADSHGLKTIAHSHSISSGSGVSGFVKTLMQKRIRKTADQFLACSNEAGLWLFGDEVVEQPNFHVMNNAIEGQKYIYNEEIRNQWRNKLALNDHLVIGHLGRFHESKNHIRLLELFSSIHEVIPHAKLMLIGDGELSEQIKEKTEELNLSDHVLFMGSRNDAHELLQAMDVFLFPSKYEGLGIAVVEAQASSLPCVVSDTVPDEAVYTKLVTSVNLDEPDSVWVKQIEKAANLERKSRVTLEDLKEAHYDIAEIASWYNRYVTNLLTKES